MNKLEDTVNSIHNDLQPLSISREEFLAQCVSERIKYQTKKYNDSFDKFLSSLEKRIDKGDINSTLIALKHFSDTISYLYSSLISDFNKYKRNIFDKFS